MRIVEVSPIQGVHDVILWTLEMQPDWWGTGIRRRLLLEWVGDLVLTREPIPRSSRQTRARTPMRLPTRWIDRERLTKVFSDRTYRFVFETVVPSEALTRIDAFREGGPLFARIEGQMFTLVLDEHFIRKSGESDPSERLLRAWNQLEDSSMSVWGEIYSEPFEIAKELWCSKILGTFRPPGRAVFEMIFPDLATSSDRAGRCIQYLKEAQASLDDHRPSEAARHVYRVIDVLSQLDESIRARHGEFIAKRLQQQRKELGAIANQERHGHKGADEAPPPISRSMAQHLLTSMWSLCAVYFAP